MHLVGLAYGVLGGGLTYIEVNFVTTAGSWNEFIKLLITDVILY